MRTRDRQIAGEQFIINKCKKCKIFLKDYSAAVNIYYCEDCEIFIGPCASSAYFRNCQNCKVVLATSQLRMYKCDNFTMLVFSLSDPSLEECLNLKLGCFDYSYFNLRGTLIIASR